MQTTFPANYVVDEQAELPGSGSPNVHYFPNARPRGVFGMLIRVRPADDQPWIGCFASGGSASAATEVMTCPNSGELCVVSGGAGYLVAANNPQQWTPLPCHPVRQIMGCRAYNLILFADYTEVLALGPRGVLWKSGRLVTDEMKLERVEGRIIHARGWEPGGDVELQIDVETGTLLHKTSLNPLDRVPPPRFRSFS